MPADLGIISDLEAAFWPGPGELVVVYVDRNRRICTAAPQPWEKPTCGGSWEDFVPRYCGPWDTARTVNVGDVVTPRWRLRAR